MRQDSWRIELDEFIQNITASEYPITYHVYKDLHGGEMLLTMYGSDSTGILIHSILVPIPREVEERVGGGIDRGVTYTRFEVPLGLVNLLASKSEEYRVYMCRSLGVQ